MQFVGAVGDDAAAEPLRTHLLVNGVGLDATAAVPGPSGTTIVVVDAGAENTIVVAPGANGQLTLSSAASRALADCDVLLTQLEIPLATAVAAAREAKAAGAAVIVNASPSHHERNALTELVDLADVVITNEAEANELPWRPAHLVTTLGSRGARYVSPDDELWIPAPEVNPVDTTGAGDVFAGVLAAHWPRDPGSRARRLVTLQRACTAAALSTLVPGAGDCAPHRDAIDAAMPDPAR